MKEHLREDMLDVVVDCYISETDTISHLDMSDVIVSEDADDAEAIKCVKSSTICFLNCSYNNYRGKNKLVLNDGSSTEVIVL